MLVDNAQFTFAVGDEHLGSTPVFQVLIGSFAHAARNPVGVETESVAGNRRVLADQLHVDGSGVNANGSLFVEVLATPASYGQASRLGTDARRTEDSSVGSVKFLKQVGGFGREHRPETVNFGANFFGGYSRHDKITLS